MMPVELFCGSGVSFVLAAISSVSKIRVMGGKRFPSNALLESTPETKFNETELTEFWFRRQQ